MLHYDTVAAFTNIMSLLAIVISQPNRQNILRPLMLMQPWETSPRATPLFIHFFYYVFTTQLFPNQPCLILLQLVLLQLFHLKSYIVISGYCCKTIVNHHIIASIVFSLEWNYRRSSRRDSFFLLALSRAVRPVRGMRRERHRMRAGITQAVGRGAGRHPPRRVWWEPVLRQGRPPGRRRYASRVHRPR